MFLDPCVGAQGNTIIGALDPCVGVQGNPIRDYLDSCVGVQWSPITSDLDLCAGVQGICIWHGTTWFELYGCGVSTIHGYT